MEGVVQAGTATVVKEVGKPIAGKTGTTNEAKDAWFVGFSPDVAVAHLHGLRQAARARQGQRRDRRPSGRARSRATSSSLRSPTSPPFRSRCRPASSWSASISKTGMRAGPGETGGTILEAFKPGTAPPDNYSVIGVADADGRGGVPASQQQQPDSGFFMRPGTGGLY